MRNPHFVGEKMQKMQKAQVSEFGIMSMFLTLEIGA